MRRMDFIKKLSYIWTGIGLLSVNNKLHGYEIHKNTIKIIDFYIAGYVYYDGENIENRIGKNEILTIKRESTNIHDSYAIEIYWNNYKLGYVPRQHNEILAKIMDSDINLYAKIKSINKSDPTWERVIIEIYMESV